MIQRCCYCSTNNYNPDAKLKGHRVMCDKCRKTHQPLSVSSTKCNKKRIISEFKKKIRRRERRKIVKAPQKMSTPIQNHR